MELFQQNRCEIVKTSRAKISIFAKYSMQEFLYTITWAIPDGNEESNSFWTLENRSFHIDVITSQSYRLWHEYEPFFKKMRTQSTIGTQYPLTGCNNKLVTENFDSQGFNSENHMKIPNWACNSIVTMMH